MIKVKYKAISNKQPSKVDWRTVKEFFEATGMVKANRESRWSIENGSVYVERSYKTNDEWEESIYKFHKNSKPIREFRFEIVDETNEV